NASAWARPRPLPAPVTTTTRSLISNGTAVLLLLSVCGGPLATGSGRCAFEFFADLLTHDLHRRVAWDRIRDVHPHRRLVRRKPATRPCDEFVGGDSVDGDHDRDRHFAEPLIGYAERHRLTHLRMRFQAVLQFGGEDLETAAVDDVVGTAVDPDESVFV